MNENEPVAMIAERTQPPKRLGKFVMIPLLAGMVVLCMFSNEWKKTLKLEKVGVEGAKTLSVRAILAAANVDSEAPLYSMDLMAIRKKVLSEPFLKDVRLNREFPGRLQLHLTEREPVATLNFGQMRYVDQEGVVLPYLDGDRRLDLPLIIGIDGLKSERVGKPILNKELFMALEILRQAQALDSTIYRMISELDMKRGGDITIYTLDAGVPVILGRQEIPRKLLLFETFWTNFVNSGDAEKLKYVDLRFDDQVVVRWSESAEAHTNNATL